MLWSVAISMLLVSAVRTAPTLMDCAMKGQCLNPLTNECADIGTVINDDTCNPKECTKINRSIGFRYQESFKCTSTDASGQMQCHKENDTWEEECFTKKCVKEDRDGTMYYVSKIVSNTCADDEGNCHPVGSPMFTYTINGRTSNKCSCIEHEGTIMPLCMFSASP